MAHNLKNEEWNNFVFESNGGFLQSFEWGEFQKSLGRKTFLLASKDFQALIIRYNLPLGRNYLYCPRGPVILSKFAPLSVGSAKNLFQSPDFLNGIKNLAKQEKSIFIRIEPTSDISGNDLEGLGFIKTKDVQPSKTLMLDLEKSEEELLAGMHEKTRYNIRLAEKKGIIVKKSQISMTNDQFDKFWDLIKKTAQRQKIRIFPKEHYRKQLEINSGQFENSLFFAEYQEKTIAANLLNIYGDIATYLHGGSDNKYRALMAPHLLQWEQIKYAKSKGCKYYDFWGIDEARWPGVTRFKKGFGGREIEYIGTWDFAFDKFWYKLYNFARVILR